MTAAELIKRLEGVKPDEEIVFYTSPAFGRMELIPIEDVAWNPTTFYVVVLNPPENMKDQEDPMDYFKNGDPAVEMLKQIKEGGPAS